MQNGTCATLVALWKATLEALNVDLFEKAFDEAQPLRAEDVMLSPDELDLYQKSLVHAIWIQAPPATTSLNYTNLISTHFQLSTLMNQPKSGTQSCWWRSSLSSDTTSRRTTIGIPLRPTMGSLRTWSLPRSQYRTPAQTYRRHITTSFPDVSRSHIRLSLRSCLALPVTCLWEEVAPRIWRGLDLGETARLREDGCDEVRG